MPKSNIDYSNTIIYKIYCKDESVTDLYVGHTTNFQQRKYSHKVACNNNKNDIKIYNVIRENGGWDNWIMIEIAKYNCKNSTEARIKEQEHYDNLKASLNSCPPFVDKSKYFCNTCNLQCDNFSIYEKHIKCNLHLKKKENPSEENSPQLGKYICTHCDYSTCNIKDYNRHLSTNKHVNRVALNNLEQNTQNKTTDFVCKKCNKCYKARNSLWYHEQKCDGGVNLLINSNNLDDKHVIMLLLKQNAQLMEQNNNLLKLLQNGTHNTENVNNNT